MKVSIRKNKISDIITEIRSEANKILKKKKQQNRISNGNRLANCKNISKKRKIVQMKISNSERESAISMKGILFYAFHFL